LAGVFQKRKGGGSFFWGNSGGVGRTYLVVMAPIFKGQPELMAAIPSLNDPTTQPTPSITQPFSPYSREAESLLHIITFELFLFLLLFFFFSFFLSDFLFVVNGVVFKKENEGARWQFFE
jgi:hypothetical protein